MNENTQFVSSVLRNLKPRKDVNPKFFDNLIATNCDIDQDIKDLISDVRHKIEDNKKDLEKRMKNVFRFFFDSGKFIHKIAEKVEQKFGSDFIATLVSLNILESFTDSVKPRLGVQYKVAKEYNNVRRTLEGNLSTEFDMSVNLVYNELARK